MSDLNQSVMESGPSTTNSEHRSTNKSTGDHKSHRHHKKSSGNHNGDPPQSKSGSRRKHSGDDSGYHKKSKKSKHSSTTESEAVAKPAKVKVPTDKTQPKKSTRQTNAETILNTAYGYFFKRYPTMTCVVWKLVGNTPLDPPTCRQLIKLVYKVLSEKHPHAVCAVFNNTTENGEPGSYLMMGDPTVTLNESTLSVNRIIKKSKDRSCNTQVWNLVETSILNTCVPYRPLMSTILPTIVDSSYVTAYGPNYGGEMVSISTLMMDGFFLKHSFTAASRMMTPAHSGSLSGPKFGYQSQGVPMFQFDTEQTMVSFYYKLVNKQKEHMQMSTRVTGVLGEVTVTSSEKVVTATSSTVTTATVGSVTEYEETHHDAPDEEAGASGDADVAHVKRKSKSSESRLQRFAAPKLSKFDKENLELKNAEAHVEQVTEEMMEIISENENLERVIAGQHIDNSDLDDILSEIINDTSSAVGNSAHFGDIMDFSFMMQQDAGTQDVFVGNQPPTPTGETTPTVNMTLLYTASSPTMNVAVVNIPGLPVVVENSIVPHVPSSTATTPQEMVDVQTPYPSELFDESLVGVSDDTGPEDDGTNMLSAFLDI